jgi:hypothetical protein
MLSAMKYAKLGYSLEQVDRAGELLVSTSDPNSLIVAKQIVNNWRAAHAYPLSTFQVTLKARALSVDPGSIAYGRTKREGAIADKLGRLKRLSLSQIQDIVGCRAVVDSAGHVYDLAEIYHDRRRHWDQQLEGIRDYIANPKENSGYRSYHLVYRHHSPTHPEHDGRKVEVQLRSQLQHDWATAVETADVFLGRKLKFYQEPADWNRFFCLMGTAIALREGCVPVPGTPTNEKELVTEIRQLVDQLEIARKFDSWGKVLGVMQSPPKTIRSAHYWVLHLEPQKSRITIWGFPAGKSEEASDQLFVIEKNKSDDDDAVLVSVAHADELRRAYPNYFLDTGGFLGLLREVVS